MSTSARMLRLLSLLQTHRFWPGRDLAERLDVSERTLRRDIDRLRDLGYPVDATRGHAGGYRLRAGTAMPPLLLDDDEAVAIALGLAAAVNSIAGIEETSVRALAKLTTVMPPRLRHRVDAVRTATVSASFAAPATDPAALVVLAQACRDNERLRFTYTPRPQPEELAPGSGPAAPDSGPAAPDSGPAPLGSGAAAPGSGPAPLGSGAVAPGSGAAPLGSGAVAPGSGAAPLGSGAVAPGSGAAPLGSGAATSGSGPATLGGSAAPGSGAVAPGSGAAPLGSGPAAPGSGAPSSRVVEPHRLVNLGRRWYLVAWDLDRADWRTFRCDRLTDPAPTGAHFRHRAIPGGDPATFVRDRLGGAPTRYHVDVTVHAPTADVAPVIANTGGTLEPLGECHCRLTMDVDDLHWPAFTLGAIPAPFTITSPPELGPFLHDLAERYRTAAHPVEVEPC